jgi:hypothetical protein
MKKNSHVSAVTASASVFAVAAIILISAAAVSCRASGLSSDTPIQPPTVVAVDRSMLQSAIGMAYTVNTDVQGIDNPEEAAAGVKFVSTDDKAAFEALILDMEEESQRPDVTQGELNASGNALLRAITDFQGKIQTGSNSEVTVAYKTDLFDKIVEANAAKATVAIIPTTTADAPWVSSADLGVFNSAISLANGVASSQASLQAEVDSAVSTLDTAIAAFNAARKFPIPITFSAVATTEPNGITTSITLTFSEFFDSWPEDAGIGDLASTDITLFDGIGTEYKKDGLERLGGTTAYRHNIQNVTAETDIGVHVRKGGYVIVPNEVRVATLHYAEQVEFYNVTAEGSPNTTAIILNFNKEIVGFNADDIAISNVDGVNKINSPLVKTTIENGVSYKMGITSTNGGILSVKPSKNGYFISDGVDNIQEVNLNYSAPASFISATPHEAAGTTTSITLAFSRNIDGLASTHFTISPVIGGDGGSAAVVNVGILTPREGSIGLYDLAINTTSKGDVNITVNKSDVESTRATLPVSLSKAIAATLASVTTNDDEDSGKTYSISLYFTTEAGTALEIDGLSENDITFAGADDIGGIYKGALIDEEDAPGHYTLPVSGFDTSGEVNISVSKTGYTFTGLPYENVYITYTSTVNLIVVSPIEIAGKTSGLRLYFSNSIDGLKKDNIHLTNTANQTSLDGLKTLMLPDSQSGIGVYLLALNVTIVHNNIAIAVTVTPPADYYIPTPNPAKGAVLKFSNSVVVNFTGSIPAAWSPPSNGTYRIQVWGAQGGISGGQLSGGKGGYAEGKITLTMSDTLYIYTGAMGLSGSAGGGGWNGGG